jgi:single-stranded-DNA-specific exonuclease
MVTKQAFQLKDRVTPHGISFYIAPGVNAITRVGTVEEKLMLFESMLEFRAYEQIPSTKRGCKGQFETRVEQACRNCTNIRNRQNKARDASLEIIERIIEEKNLLENQVLAVKLEGKNESNRNITGLIANQLMGRYQRPVLLLNRTVHDEDPDNVYVTWDGSGRNANGTDLTNFQEFLNESGYFEFAEGHDNAFGVSIRDEYFADFIKYANEKLKDVDFSPKYSSDVIYFANMVHGSEILKLADLGHIWGQGVEEPLIAITDIKVDRNNLNLFGSTLKIALPSDEGISLVKFRSSNEEYESLYSELGCVTINVVGRCSRNSGWDDKPQIIIEDYEIVGRTAYYF